MVILAKDKLFRALADLEPITCCSMERRTLLLVMVGDKNTIKNLSLDDMAELFNRIDDILSKEYFTISINNIPDQKKERRAI